MKFLHVNHLPKPFQQDLDSPSCLFPTKSKRAQRVYLQQIPWIVGTVSPLQWEQHSSIWNVNLV